MVEWKAAYSVERSAGKKVVQKVERKADEMAYWMVGSLAALTAE